MRRCTTLAFLLSLSACEPASQATPTTPPTPEPHPKPAISAQPKVEPKKPLPKVPCRARACPEWERPAPIVTEPERPAPSGTPKIRVQKRPEASK